MNEVKEGSLWDGGEGKKFRVLHLIEINGNTWVHYRQDGCDPSVTNCQEYSCYLESFLARFRSVPN